ncbi:hypothetical protein BU16DRAFT_543431 [Lophium mytilinum]|uniref:Uncharacterized protein n=1 Tax=Lophium mytilinum TaxID=390894 RepID=A0A6A6QGN9_9PEZI|nr:hypothetical protein BU16DRAFT_543431 [Lophium mytilinum]
MASSANPSAPLTRGDPLSVEAVLLAASNRNLLTQQQAAVYLATPLAKGLQTVKVKILIDDLTCARDYLRLFESMNSKYIWELVIQIEYPADRDIMTLDLLPFREPKGPMTQLLATIGPNLRRLTITLVGFKIGIVQTTFADYERIGEGAWELDTKTLKHPLLPSTSSA